MALDFSLAGYQPNNMLDAYAKGVNFSNQQQQNELEGMMRRTRAEEMQRALAERDMAQQLWQQSVRESQLTGQSPINLYHAKRSQMSPEGALAAAEYQKANRPTISGGQAIGYDEQGNPVARPIQGYTQPQKESSPSNLQRLFTERAKTKPGSPEWNFFTSAIKKESEPAATQSTPYFQAVGTPQGIMRFNARTGQMEPVQISGENVVKSSDSPELQASIAGAKESATTKAQSEAKRAATMAGISSVISEARSVLDGKIQPTASGAGAAYDVAASVVGMAPKGAAEADRLEAIGGALVSKMPRMEGPQSDFDVRNYKIMAGRVGDRTLPVSRRKEALDTVERLWAKYEHLNKSGENAGNNIDALLDKYK